MNIGEHINAARKKRGITIDELAKKSYVSRNTICSWIYYDRHPDIELLIPVAEVLEMSLDELVGRSETKADTPKTWYDRITAMPIDELASFLVYLSHRGVIATADKYICRKCKAENGGHCNISDDDKCPYDVSDKETVKLWLEIDGYQYCKEGKKNVDNEKRD